MTILAGVELADRDGGAEDGESGNDGAVAVAAVVVVVVVVGQSAVGVRWEIAVRWHSERNGTIGSG
jgi:hypothetical protein